MSAGAVAERAGKVALSATGSALSAVGNAGAAAAGAVGSQVIKYETTTVLRLMRFMNLINGVALVAAGVTQIINVGSCGTSCNAASLAIISFHLIVLGTLLFLFEARMGDTYEGFFRKYFGFMYGQWGRLLFLGFLASLSWGLWNTSLPLFIVPVLVSIYTTINAILSCFIIRHHPGFQSGEAQALEREQRSVGVGVGAGAGASSAGLGDAPIASSRPAYSTAPVRADNPFAVSQV